MYVIITKHWVHEFKYQFIYIFEPQEKISYFRLDGSVSEAFDTNYQDRPKNNFCLFLPRSLSVKHGQRYDV